LFYIKCYICIVVTNRKSWALLRSHSKC